MNTISQTLYNHNSIIRTLIQLVSEPLRIKKKILLCIGPTLKIVNERKMGTSLISEKICWYAGLFFWKTHPYHSAHG